MKHDWDLSPGFTEKIDGFKYIVTAVDYRSKFNEAEPLKDKTGEVVTPSLYKLLS